MKRILLAFIFLLLFNVTSLAANSVTTNTPTNVSAFLATLNATLNTKDHALYSYGFVWMEGTSGDPRYGESGVSSGGYYTDLEAGTSYSYQLRLKANTTYRVAALAVDGTTFEFFYGETVDLVTPEFVHTPFTGTVKIEGVPWTGEIVTIGVGKEFPSLYEATEYVNALGVPCVYIVYDDFDSIEDSYFRYDSYVVGIGSPEIAIKSGFNGRSGFETLENLTKFYMDNISIVVDNSISWSRRLIEDWVGGAMKFNKVRLDIQNAGELGADLIESCSTPIVIMNNVSLNIENIHSETDHHINIPEGATEGSSFSKITYNTPWTQHGLDSFSVDNAVIGTAGYGYEYGTANALIAVTEGTATINYFPFIAGEAEVRAYFALPNPTGTVKDLNAQIKTIKAGGTVTLSGLTGNISNSTSYQFVTNPSSDLRKWLGYYITFTSSAGNTLKVKVSAEGTSETVSETELIVNGDMSSSTGWTTSGSGWEITGGKGVATSALSSSELIQNRGTILGLFKYSATVDAVTDGAVRVNRWGTASSNLSVGTITGYWTKASTSSVGFIVSGTTSCVVDDFSVKRVLTPSALGVYFTDPQVTGTFNYNAASYTAVITKD